MTTYDVTVSREDELWVADVAGMTAATDVLRFGDLDVEVRDLIAGLTDADPDGFETRWHHRAGGDDVSALTSELTEVEAAAETATGRVGLRAVEQAPYGYGWSGEVRGGASVRGT